MRPAVNLSRPLLLGELWAKWKGAGQRGLEKRIRLAQLEQTGRNLPPPVEQLGLPHSSATGKGEGLWAGNLHSYDCQCEGLYNWPVGDWVEAPPSEDETRLETGVPCQADCFYPLLLGVAARRSQGARGIATGMAWERVLALQLHQGNRS